jgi:hypothetical protein
VVVTVAAIHTDGAELDRSNGREIEPMTGGFLAILDGPARIAGSAERLCTAAAAGAGGCAL